MESEQETKVLAGPTKTQKAKFVQILKDGSTFIADLPIDKHFNDGSGALWYINRGFIPYDTYMADKHQKEVAARAAREAAEKAAKDAADKAAKDAEEKAAKEAADKAAQEAADKAAQEASKDAEKSEKPEKAPKK